MRIINLTKNTVLADNAFMADTTFKRIKGLLGRKCLAQGEALIIKSCNSIHTFFMHFPIDVLFVDKNNRVVKALSSLQPFHLSNIYFKAVRTIELPAGVLKTSSTQEGDTLLIK